MGLTVGAFKLLSACGADEAPPESADAGTDASTLPGDAAVPPTDANASNDATVTEDTGVDGALDDAAADAQTDDASDGSTDAQTPVDAGPPAVQFIGRFDLRSPTEPRAAWPGTRIIARFQGTSSVSVTLDEHYETWMAPPGGGAPSEWDVIVDDVPTKKLVMTQGTMTYPLATGLSAGPHKVELFKRSETQNGITQFMGFDFHGGALLPPPLRATRRIEVIGDSSSTGYGVETTGAPFNDCPGPDNAAKHQNFRKAWPSVVGRMTSAEVHGIVYSGKGLTRNVFRPDTDTIAQFYPRANPNPNLQGNPPLFDLSSWTPDAIVIMLGANDFSDGSGSPNPGPATAGEFLSAYRSFVGTTLRPLYPSALIVLAVSPSVVDGQPGNGALTRTNIENTITTVVSERIAAGDTKVTAFAPAVSPADELDGCGGHGNPKYHDRIATELAKTLKAKLGW
jgi:lysophospholipase L1-like esterase